MTLDSYKQTVIAAAHHIRSADAILIGAGAGMGVDSGLPDFRGKQGFWRAYPHFAKRGLSFTDMANPQWFFDDPAQAWGFYGHRYNLYASTDPHQGFSVLQRWIQQKALGGFVFTSNVDGHFQKAGVAATSVLECHGSIRHLQCVNQCTTAIWPADIQVQVDERLLQAVGPLPRCPGCGGIARPNILMFGDFGWVPDRTDEQERRYRQWLTDLSQQGGRLVVVELGAGEAVPTVRYECERMAARFERATFIRINPRDTQAPQGSLVLAGGAMQTLLDIERRLQDESGSNQ